MIYLSNYTIYRYSFQVYFSRTYAHELYLPNNRILDLTLDLGDPQYPDQDLGTIDLGITLSPKDGDIRETVRENISIYNLYIIYAAVTLSLLCLFHNPLNHLAELVSGSRPNQKVVNLKFLTNVR